MWGITYQIVESDTFHLDHNQRLLYCSDSVDHKKALSHYEVELLLQELESLIAKYYDNGLINISGVHYTIKPMKTRYGSCHKLKRRISINQRLIHVEQQYLEYVFLHEITHLIHGHHQAEFYQLFEQLCPHYKSLKKSLQQVW